MIRADTLSYKRELKNNNKLKIYNEKCVKELDG